MKIVLPKVEYSSRGRTLVCVEASRSARLAGSSGQHKVSRSSKLAGSSGQHTVSESFRRVALTALVNTK